MDKYKVCPTCGTQNPPSMMECVNCETDLTGVVIGEILQADGEAQQNNSDIKPAEDNFVKMVRVCECGEKNPASLRKCAKCGEDISDIIPVQDSTTDSKEEIHYILSSLDGNYAYELKDNLTVVGRENKMADYLSTKTYVSRRHAQFLVEADKLWIKNHSNTNHTYLNNDMITDEGYVELHDGDVIGLGGKEINGSVQDDAAFFRVRIGTCI